ncbi:GNAT family N-acetyltransferase [Bradyrhizobium sp. 2TAF36]|uniref:GNAT family N-acetyltransferase n=1 Tax=Bradyrhizobium sp. 2TAF36 TaxID=3233016 RepID=UPI003F91E4A7
MPEAAYRDAIAQRRLFAMFARSADSIEIAGFILFSGVFPNARVQQVAVAPSHRRNGIASALVNALVSHLENRGYLNVTAAVASDLDEAQAFYEKKGFVARRVRDGGAARQRTIVLRSKELDTASLFSLMAPPTAGDELVANLKLRSPGAFEAPLYAIDLNVLFDLIKQRARSAVANRLWIYATRPTAAVVGMATIAGVSRAHPRTIWQKHRSETGVDYASFTEYFAGATEAVAILLAAVKQVQPITLGELRRVRAGFHPPQVLVRLTSKEAEALEKLAKS